MSCSRPCLACPTPGSPGTPELLPGDLAAEHSWTYSLARAIRPSRLPAAPPLLPITNTDLLLQITVVVILAELPVQHRARVPRRQPAPGKKRVFLAILPGSRGLFPASGRHGPFPTSPPHGLRERSSPGPRPAQRPFLPGARARAEGRA